MRIIILTMYTGLAISNTC